MSAASAHELWAKLEAAGLTTGDMPEIGEAHTPWYVRVMLGVAGWIAAAFLLGFIGIAFTFVMRSKSASLAVGVMVIAAAYGIFRAAPRKDFTTMFALAVSFAGQALMTYGLFGFFGHRITGALPFATIAAIQAVLAIVMPNFIHRVASAYAAGIAFAYACAAAGFHFVAGGIVAAAVAGMWLNEGRLGRLHSIVAPIGYGLTLAFMQIEGAALLGHSLAMLFRPRIMHASPWAGEALVAAALIVSVWVLLRRAGWAPQAGKTLLALLAILAVGAASFKAPGIAGGLMITLLGFSNGNRVLAGLGIAALVCYVSGYYYLLDATLLVKSGVLLATGAALLVARWVVLNLILPERADA